MTTVQQLYEAMQALAPLELADSWDNPGLLVDCGGEVSRVLVALDVTAETLCLLYTSPSPRDISGSRMPSSA